MYWTPISQNTFLPQLPKAINYNFLATENLINIFYDQSNQVLLKPLTTKGRVKASSGEFVNIVVDNLTVKTQFTNMYDNITTADYSYYKMYVDTAVIPRDPCTAVNNWPYEDPSYKVVDVEQPYYKLSNAEPVQLFNENLSQVVGFYLDTSIVGSGNFQILTDVCLGTTYDIDPSYAGTYIEFVADSYDPSWGSTWDIYKGFYDTGQGQSGYVGPGTPGTIPIFNATNEIGDSSLYVDSSGDFYMGGDLYVNGNLVGTYDPDLEDTIEMEIQVGGLYPGTSVGSLRGDTVQEILSDILFPPQYPDLTAYTAIPRVQSFADNQSTLQMVGDTLNISFSTTFYPGLIDPLYSPGTSSRRAGPVNKYVYTGDTIAGDVISTSDTDSQSITGYEVLIGYQDWGVTIHYDEGVQVYNNKGDAGPTWPSPPPTTNPGPQGPYPAGTKGPSSSRIEGVYPIYATVYDDINDPMQYIGQLYSMISTSSVIIHLATQAATDPPQSFDLPDDFKPLQSISVYIPSFDSWETWPLAQWGTSSQNHTINANATNIPYTRYYSLAAGGGDATIRLNF